MTSTMVHDIEREVASELPYTGPVGLSAEVMADALHDALWAASCLAPCRGWVKLTDGTVWWYSNVGLGGFHVEPVDASEWTTRPDDF